MIVKLAAAVAAGVTGVVTMSVIVPATITSSMGDEVTAICASRSLLVQPISLAESNESLQALGLRGEQLQNVQIIATIAKRRGLKYHDALIGLATAGRESNWKNLPYGDRDSQGRDLTSRGMFQQRFGIIDAKGRHYWGTEEQVQDPVYATNRFYEELEKKSNRYGMSVTEAAQAVQGSKYPEAYQAFVGISQQILAILNVDFDSSSTSDDNPVALNTYQDTMCAEYAIDSSMISASGDWAVPLSSVSINQKCGWRRHPVTGARGLHDGDDLAASMNTPVYAIADGVIEEAGYQTAWGNTVVINHGTDKNGHVIKSRVAHLSAFMPGVKANVSVSKGALIGKSGSTGYSTGPHLHFSMYVDGVAESPVAFVSSGGKSLVECRNN